MRALFRVAIATVVAAGCNGDSAGDATVSGSQTTGGSTGTGTTLSTMSTAVDTSTSTSTGTTSGGIKLDVGGNDSGIPPGDPPPFPETCEEAMDGLTSVGCEFYPLNLPGAGGPTAAFIASNVSSQTATVTLSNAFGVLDTQMIQPGATYSFDGSGQDISAATAVTQDGYVIESDQPLQVYQLMPPQIAATNDASIVLPAPTLGTRHRVVTYNDQFNTGVHQVVAVVATEDATDVTFTLEQAGSRIEGGGPVPNLDKDGGPEATTVTLDRLEVLLLSGRNTDQNTMEWNTDLSGSVVESTKPVAVYSGNDVTYVPAECPNDCCCADLISTAVPPITTWGRFYAGVKLLPLGEGIDVWRFIADEDGTTVTLSGDENQVIDLDAGEFADVLSAGVFLISSNHEIGVAHFMTSGTATNIPNPGLVPYDCNMMPITYPGDPAVTWVYPVGNWLHRYVFEVGLANTGTWCHDHITVVALTASWDSITLDGAALPAPTSVGNTALGFAYVPVDDGTHEILAPPEVAVEVMVYGYSGHGSYLFPGGMGLKELNPEG